jgi:hypothetical protein
MNVLAVQVDPKPIETADALETACQNLETVALEYGVRVIQKAEQ